MLDQASQQFAAEFLFYYGLAFVATLCFVIFIHELGHFLLARLFGVRVTTFSIGFGKEIFGFFDKRGTRWCVSWIPLGGYVGIFGDVDPDNPLVWDKENKVARLMTEDELAVAFCTKPVWQRSLIVAAGPFINFILTFVLMIGMYMSMGIQYSQPVINGIGLGTAAEEAGFQIGDRIVSMDGKPIIDSSDMYKQTFDFPGKEFLFEVLRGEDKINIRLTPKETVYTDVKGVDRKHGRTGMINFYAVWFKDILALDGIQMNKDYQKIADYILDHLDQKIVITMEFRKGQTDDFLLIIPKKYNQKFLNDTFFDKEYKIFISDEDERFFRRLGIFAAASKTYEQISKGLYESYLLISAVIQQKSQERVVSGVGSVSEKIGKAAKSGIYDFILMISVLSFMIGFINLLPIPAFDGGYLLFFLIEAIRGKPLSQKIQSYCMIFGLVLIGGIMVFANVSDLIQLFG